MNFLDLVFAAITAYFLIRGAFRGFIVEIAGIAGVVAGFFLANKYHQQLTPQVERILDMPRWSATAAYLLIFVGSIILVSLLARLLRNLTPSMAVWLDKLAGAVVGVVKAALICLVFFLVLSQYMPQSELVQNARSAPWLQKAADKLRPLLPEVKLPEGALPRGLDPGNAPAPGEPSEPAPWEDGGKPT